MSVPVTILGGFLGAGKTTALNALLRTTRRRIAVLVNDFGAVNVDAALIAERQGDMIALSNGCVCCTLGTDLGEGIARLAALRPAPEQIVIEASGVSDPWRIAQLARLEAGVTLDAVLVLADAARFAVLLADRWLSDTLERQVARADLVLLSQVDRASRSEIVATRDALERIRPGVPVAVLEPDSLDALFAAPQAEASRFIADTPPLHEFRHWHWAPQGDFAATRLRAALAALPASVLRVKGFVHLDGMPHALQQVGRRTELVPWHGARQPNRLVLIGTAEMPPPDVLMLQLSVALLPASDMARSRISS